MGSSRTWPCRSTSCTYLGLNYDWGSGLATPWEPNAPLPGATSPSGRVCPFARQIVAQLGLPATAANLRSNSAGCLRIQIADFTNRFHIDSLSFRLEKRFTRDFGFLAGYTLGAAKGFDWTSPHIKHGEANFGPTENDVRHRFTGNFIYRFPHDVQVSSILTANSAPPYDITTGKDDNFDFLRNDRPAGVGAWAGRGANFLRWDLRLTKKFVDYRGHEGGRDVGDVQRWQPGQPRELQWQPALLQRQPGAGRHPQRSVPGSVRPAVRFLIARLSLGSVADSGLTATSKGPLFSPPSNEGA